jgi:hypothetical protein
MPHTRASLLPCLFALALLALASPAAAQTLDDRTRTTPTGWWYLPNASEAQINERLASTQSRLVDISVRSTNPWRFDVVAVHNVGAYALPAAGWFYRRTAAELRDLGPTSTNRITDIEVSLVGNTTYYAGILVPNTGAGEREWTYITAATTRQLDNRLALGWRLVSLTRFVRGGVGYWAAIIHRNSGEQFLRTWWYPSITSEEVGELLGENQAQLVDLDRTPAGRWTAVMVDCAPCANWGWFYDASSPNALLDRVEHNGLRLINARVYGSGGNARWSGVAVENLDATARRISNVMGADNRKRGFYLKQVNGFVRTALRPDMVHEPLSAVKVLIHLRAFQEIALGLLDLEDTDVDRLQQVGNPPCWQGLGTTEPLEDALRLMMQNSDNARTKSVLTLVGRTDVNRMVATMGLENTSIQSMDCPPRPANRWTLREAGQVYEAVARGTSLPSRLRRDFYRLMPGRGGFDGPVTSVIDSERPAGMSAADIASFRNGWDMHYKAGSWDHGGDQYFDAVRAVNVAGVIELPYCIGSRRTSRQFVFGMVVESAPGGSAYDDYNRTRGELFREVIRESLAIWGNCAP